MSEATSTTADEETKEKEDGAETEAAPSPPDRRRKLMLGALGGLVLLGGAGGAGWWFLAPSPGKDEQVAEAPEVFVDVAPIQVALRGADGSRRMLKLHVMLVPGTRTPEEITPRLPLLIDRFQPFLRELRPEDLSGSAATFRVKEELLIRANQALGEGAVKDVLIQDLMQA